MPWGVGEGRFFFVITHQKIYSPSSALPSYYLVCGSVFVLFLFFDDEVEKVFILQTFHASLGAALYFCTVWTIMGRLT